MMWTFSSIHVWEKRVDRHLTLYFFDKLLKQLSAWSTGFLNGIQDVDILLQSNQWICNVSIIPRFLITIWSGKWSWPMIDMQRLTIKLKINALETWKTISSVFDIY